jgi:DNA adenine methylase
MRSSKRRPLSARSVSASSRLKPRDATGSPEPQPFLKWAGGKSQLLEQFEPFFPQKLESYCEPFLGGGAVFFHLKARFPGMKARLCDNNAELINCYTVVRDQVGALMIGLDEHVRQFRAEGERYYYLVRSQHHLTDTLARAARMIFLNKTCYNGLWRVNARGEFNVPIGSYRPEKVTLYDRENLLSASRALAGADLVVQDFRDVLASVSRGEFAYIDPPYYPVSATANFTSYTKEDFGKAEQEELSALYADAARRGVRLMLSNSDAPFIRGLYESHQVHTVKARRAVNSDGAKRGLVSEMVVLSYEPGRRNGVETETPGAGAERVPRASGRS